MNFAKQNKFSPRSSNNIQAIIFEKNHWKKDDIYHWLKMHHYKPLKEIHETENYYRVRLQEPEQFKRFITKATKYHMDFIIGFPK